MEACKTSSEGEPCVLKEPTKGTDGVSYRDIDGTCQPDECCEQDYSKGSPPEVTCSACLACKPGDPSPTPTAEPTAGGEPPKTSAGDDPPASAGSPRGCTAGGTASWASLLWLLPLAWTRRRRRG